MKAIIFGANGQDAFFLNSLLEKNSIEVIKVSRNNAPIIGDVSDYKFVNNLIEKHSPDYIFHLAASSSTSHTFLFENNQSISNGTINILESVRIHAPNSKVFLSGSAMQFKNTGVPINEEFDFDASSHYSVARIHSVFAARYYRKTFGIKAYVGYLFNHDSSLRSERHVNQKIIKAVKRIANGSSEKLELGDIDIQKEFNYAGDIVEAIWIFVNQEDIFEIIIASGETKSIKDWLEYCFQKVDKKWQDFIILNQWFEPEYKILIGDSTKIRKLGWKPKVSFVELADLMFNEKL